jgi:hypothetical protein
VSTVAELYPVSLAETQARVCQGCHRDQGVRPRDYAWHGQYAIFLQILTIPAVSACSIRPSCSIGMLRVAWIQQRCPSQRQSIAVSFETLPLAVVPASIYTQHPVNAHLSDTRICALHGASVWIRRWHVAISGLRVAADCRCKQSPLTMSVLHLRSTVG